MVNVLVYDFEAQDLKDLAVSVNFSWNAVIIKKSRYLWEEIVFGNRRPE